MFIRRWASIIAIHRVVNSFAFLKYASFYLYHDVCISLWSTAMFEKWMIQFRLGILYHRRESSRTQGSVCVLCLLEIRSTIPHVAGQGALDVPQISKDRRFHTFAVARSRRLAPVSTATQCIDLQTSNQNRSRFEESDLLAEAWAFMHSCANCRCATTTREAFCQCRGQSFL